MEKYFVAPPTLRRWAKDLIAKRGPLAAAIAGVPRFSLAFGERKAGRGKNAECELRLAIKSRSHRHGAGGELKSRHSRQAHRDLTNAKPLGQSFYSKIMFGDTI